MDKDALLACISFRAQKDDILLLSFFGGFYFETFKDPSLYSYVADYIAHQMVTVYKKNNLRIDCCSEGLPPDVISIFSKITFILTTRYNIPISSISFLSGGAPHRFNIELYNKYCSTSDNMISVPILFTSGWEMNVFNQIKKNPEFYDKFSSTPRVKGKILLSFNNRPAAHRIYLIGQIVSMGLHTNSFCSFYTPYSKFDAALSLSNAIHYMPRLCENTKQLFSENSTVFPLKLNMNPSGNPIIDILDDFNYFNDSYFSVVTENKFFADIPGIIDVQLDCYLFSEKTYKPISAKHPFILAGRHYSLQVLRDLGYKTFHPWINETYDTIINDEDRLVAITNEIKRLSNFTETEWLLWQTSIGPIVEHNFNVLRNAEYTELSN